MPILGRYGRIRHPPEGFTGRGVSLPELTDVGKSCAIFEHSTTQFAIKRSDCKFRFAAGQLRVHLNLLLLLAGSSNSSTTKYYATLISGGDSKFNTSFAAGRILQSQANLFLFSVRKQKGPLVGHVL